MRTAQFLVFMLFSVSSLFIGLFLLVKPQLAIELQRRFYAKINWRMEPISMPKEIRNTRLMGFSLITLLLITVLMLILKNLTP